MEIHNYESKDDELKECPFCGDKAVWYLIGNANDRDRKRTIVVRCPTCGARQETSVLHLPTKFGCMDAIVKWNMRVKKED